MGKDVLTVCVFVSVGSRIRVKIFYCLIARLIFLVVDGYLNDRCAGFGVLGCIIVQIIGAFLSSVKVNHSVAVAGIGGAWRNADYSICESVCAGKHIAVVSSVDHHSNVTDGIRRSVFCFISDIYIISAGTCIEILINKSVAAVRDGRTCRSPIFVAARCQIRHELRAGRIVILLGVRLGIARRSCVCSEKTEIQNRSARQKQRRTQK